MTATPGNGSYSGSSMPDTIGQAVEYITEKMDQIIAIEAKTSDMQADPALVRATSVAGTVELATLSTTGLGNYSTQNGFPQGAATLSWQSYTLANDRGIRLVLDRKQTMQSGGLATAANAAAELMRQQVIPEIDATRMAKLYAALYAQNATNSNVVTSAKPTAANVVGKLIGAIDDVCNATGLDEGLTVYVNGDLRGLIDTSSEVGLTRDVTTGADGITTMSRSINGNKLVFVPAARMKTTVTLNDGFTNAYSDTSTTPPTVDKTKYGFAGGATDIWFAVVAPGVANGVTAINTLGIIPAEQSEQFDGDVLKYRVYHDLIVPDNKTPAAYMLIKS